jgi:hypothetical protein
VILEQKRERETTPFAKGENPTKTIRIELSSFPLLLDFMGTHRERPDTHHANPSLIMH